MMQIVGELSLCDEVACALVDPSGPDEVSQTLRMVMAYERGGWSALSEYALNESELSSAYSDAVEGTAALTI